MCCSTSVGCTCNTARIDFRPPPPGCVCGAALQNWPGYDRALFTLTVAFWRQIRGGRCMRARTPPPPPFSKHDSDGGGLCSACALCVCTARADDDTGEGTTERNEHRRQTEFTEPFPRSSYKRTCRGRWCRAAAAAEGGRGAAAVWDDIVLYGGGGGGGKYYSATWSRVYTRI